MRHRTMRRNWQVTVTVGALALALLAPSAHAAPRVDDVNILSAVQARLLESPIIGNEELKLTVDNGVLKMSGTIENMRERREALRLARAVKGVRAVVDQLQLPTAHRPDRTIREEVQGALLFNPDTELASPGADIHVVVSHGTVTLRGTARSSVQRRMATEVAYGVRGVTAVDNRIRVPYLSARPDSEIKRDVEQALLWDPHIQAGLVQVTVRHGDVMLHGVVGTDMERDNAVLDSWVMGVKDVSLSRLHVRDWARDPMLRTAPALPTDGQIRLALRDALAADPRVPACDVAIFVGDHGVGLSGAVKDNAARAAAEQDARDTVGVRRVDNDIRIAPRAERSHLAVCAR